jgi:hypothetical protein
MRLRDVTRDEHVGITRCELGVHEHTGTRGEAGVDRERDLRPHTDVDDHDVSAEARLVTPSAWSLPSKRSTPTPSRIVYPIADEDWGLRHFFVRDPNGAVINVTQHHSSV